MKKVNERIKKQQRITKQQQIQERRERVKVLMGLGVNGLEISRQLKVDNKTIYTDIKRIREEWASEIRTVNLDEFIGTLCADSQRRKIESQRLYQDADTPAQTRLNCLKFQSEEDDRVIKMLQSVGKLHREPDRLELKDVPASEIWKAREQAREELKGKWEDGEPGDNTTSAASRK